MSKRLKLASQSHVPPFQPVNLDICILCQEDGGALINPTAKGYTKLATNLKALDELNKLPLNINISRLDEGDGIEETLAKRQSKWHKVCYVLCNDDKVKRAKESQICMDTIESPVKHQLRSSGSSSCNIEETQQPSCLFCGDTTGDMHKAETLPFDFNIRKMATDLRDAELLTKVSGGDVIAIDSVYHKKCYTSLYNRHRSLTKL